MAAEAERQEVSPPEGGTAEAIPEPEGSRAATSGQMKTSLDFILDIPLVVTVELGKARMLIHELLQLGQGSVIELSKLAGEPLEVLVNDKLVARGEVVVVNDKFGVRLTDIISPAERIQQLR
ncbi:MAG: flagellar motor switch protein FliN [Deltaproteobacteria bacterium]|nr:flagellar motor switch protein FliN [Deltaproteobacteria bacterium]